MGVVGEEDGEQRDDYSFVEFPGEDGHTQKKKINCRQHAMVCLLCFCASHTHTHTGVISAVWFPLCRRRCSVDGFGFVESSLEKAASGPGSGVRALPYDPPPAMVA